MTVFAVLLPTPQPFLAARVEDAYRDQHFKINDTQYLVSARGTAVEVSKKLGLESPEAGNAIVFSMSSYWGRAPTTVWDWIKTRMESP